MNNPTVAADCEGSETAEAQKQCDSVNKGKRILLIDDEEVILFGFSRFLKEPGVEVDCAQTIEEAKKCIDTHQYDAAIIDMRLSNSTEMEGFDCIRYLRSSQNAQSACRILVLTAYGDNRLMEQTKALGVDLFFEKPLEPKKLREALKTLGIYSN
ncbi:MAG: response regulator [Fibrobacterota bacterium]